MNAEDSKTEVFDVFLCHNSEDKPAVREIAKRLVSEGIKPWLDEEQIRPGTTWQAALGQQIKSTKSAAVIVGASGVGPWQDEEIQSFLNQFVKRKCPVIPTVLASAKTTPELPWTLENRHRVDFRVPEPDPLKQLIWGITGQKPSEHSHSLPQSDSPLRPEAGDVQALVPPKEKVTIEIRLPGKSIEEFSAEERDSILAALYSLLKVGEIKVTQALAGSIRLRLELTQEDADEIYAASQSGQLAALGISEARLYPGIAVPPDDDQRAQLLVLLDRVNENWVEGVLRHSLYNEVLISLGKRSMDEAVEPPWKHLVEFSSRRRQFLLKDHNIATIFDAAGLLLILGEPGSGKTTTLLELASHLIVRAKPDSKERIPVVLNLSSWTRRKRLVEWISSELSEKYQVPIKVSLRWLQNDYLVPLLDGLDEVPTALRPDCVRAINEFIEESAPAGLVVCCRLMEYQWLPKRLKLNGAICIESLSSEEVSKYLDSCGFKLAALREAVKTDAVLKELTETPLMLSIMSLAFRGASGNELAGQKVESPEERRKQIFRLYIEQMFRRKGAASLVFPKEKVICWLSWLAGKMKEYSQSVFLVEGLQPSWLGTGVDRMQYGLLVGLSLGVLGGLVGGMSGPMTNVWTFAPWFWVSFFAIYVGIGLGCWSESYLKNGAVSGLIGGLFFGLIVGLNKAAPGTGWFSSLGGPSFGLTLGVLCGLLVGVSIGLISGLGVGSLNHVISVETMNWAWHQFWKRTILGSVLGVFVGLIVGLVSLLSFTLLLGFSNGWPQVLLNFVLFFWLIFGLVSGLVGGFADRVKIDKAAPNQGITLSQKNFLTVFIVTWLTIGLGIGLMSGLINGLLAGLSVGFNLGAITALIVALNRGGSAVIKHYALRLILWLSGYTPLNFIRFLDYCARLILLKKVGGGYIFIHRMLLEYFAEMAPESNRVEAGAKASR